MNDTIAFGEEEGTVCWRNGCQGIIALQPVENCACHISPPCSACTAPREHCPVCGWRASDRGVPFNDFHIKVKEPAQGWYGEWLSWKPRPLDPRKIDFHTKPHTHASQIHEGVYPPNTTAADVEAKVRGTFGGRFKRFGEGRFVYIAYTD